MQATARRLSVVSATPRARRRLIRSVRRLRTTPVQRKILHLIVVLTSVGMIGYSGYSGFYHPYFILPRQDQAFLGAHPSRDEVLRHFGRPAEEIRAGERFPMTGWYPLPDRAASYSAFSFVRRYGSKLYVYFGAQGELEHFVISRS